MKAIKPIIKMHGEAYHYQKRRSGRKSKGKKKVKVTSIRADQDLDYTTWEDVSGDYSEANLAFSNITRQDFSKDWKCGDDYATEVYEKKKADFEKQHNKDKHWDYWVEFQLPEFETSIMGV